MKALLAATLLTVSATMPVQASDLAAPRQTPGACGNVDVLSTIVQRFGAYKAPVDIVEIRDMQLRRFAKRDRLHLVGRDYCGGQALTSDGVVRPIWYLIERDLAFAAAGSSVEFCLRGLDPTYVYGADCASLK